MGLFDHFPYTNFHELNLDWIMQMLKELSNKLENFIALNTIKYADPIQWNIATQYGANTVVIDGNTGTAYLSTKPVPSGVSLTDSQYWTVIFTLDLLSANENITFRNDSSNILATFESDAGDWLLWNAQLYKVSQHININEAYLEGYNLTRYSVESFIREYITAINNTIGDLNDLTTSDKSSIVNSINSLDANINNVACYVTPEEFGAIGDGVNDDTAAINNALDSISNGGVVILTSGKTYRVTSNVLIKHSGQTLIGYGATIITDNTTGAAYTISARSRNYNVDEWQSDPNNRLNNIKILGVHVIGGVNESMLVANCDNVLIKDCYTEGSASDSIEVRYSTHIVIDGCTMQPLNYYGLMLYQNQYMIVTNCNIDAPIQGITVKGHAANSVYVFATIANNNIRITGDRGVGIGSGVDAAEGDVIGVSILGNTITYSGTDVTDGIGIRFGDYARRNLVSNNRLLSVGMLVKGDYHKITSNHFSSYAITSRPAIQVVDSTVHQGHIVISGNFFMTNNASQPWIQSQQPQIVIENNLMNGGSGGYDIKVAGTYSVVKGNVNENTSNGLYQEFGDVIDSLNTVVDNICNGNVTGGVPYDIIKTRGIYHNNVDLSYYRDGQAPTAYKHYAGEFKYNSNPTISSGKVLIGWVCTTTGNPGTWTPCYATIS